MLKKVQRHFLWNRIDYEESQENKKKKLVSFGLKNWGNKMYILESDLKKKKYSKYVFKEKISLVEVKLLNIWR